MQSYNPRQMINNIIMITTCLIVGGAMAGILMWFLKKLNKIEEERWGKKPEKVTAGKDETAKNR